MKLCSGDTEVSLEVRGWEFPGEDWLLIALEAKTPDGSWSAVDPCLTRSEAARLGDWLGAIADGKAPIVLLRGLENLREYRLVRVEEADSEEQQGKERQIGFGKLVPVQLTSIKVSKGVSANEFQHLWSE